ncbi:CCR4-NOT transcription complex subunit 1 [Camellia lanceoleosa]|uniref:CCR4-NOT transcription complex subunit 1 n=1 Tax=Camellia lanceoleosa TaxID=1840588 RepID=A0ACC0GQH1_9ERIC|nr:CCR4-NOT transcription complex subunit 1 [Camellia lanceoleosa]
MKEAIVYSCKDFDSEGRYLFLSVIMNQMRYPNNYTHFFSYVLLYLIQNTTSGVGLSLEIEKLFESVLRSRGGPKPVYESMVLDGIPDNMH